MTGRQCLVLAVVALLACPTAWASRSLLANKANGINNNNNDDGNPLGTWGLWPISDYQPNPHNKEQWAQPRQQDTLPVQLSNVFLELVRTSPPPGVSGMFPPLIARGMAILGTCQFNALGLFLQITNQFDGNNANNGPILLQPQSLDWNTISQPYQSDWTLLLTPNSRNIAVYFAAKTALLNLFPDYAGYPSQQQQTLSLLAPLGYDQYNTTKAAAWGRLACQSALDVYATDGANQANSYKDNTGFKPNNNASTLVDRNCWQPLGAQKFAAPQMKFVTPFALTSADQFQNVAGAPAVYNDQVGSPFYTQCKAVVDYSANLNETTKAIAEYFADGPQSETPPGHWALFAQYMSRTRGNSDEDDVKMFFALGNGLLDAGIHAWNIKRVYQSVRPITAIRTLFKGVTIRAWGGPGLGTQMIQGETWNPYQHSNAPTPPFPSYVSGHSTFSSAAATVLANFFSNDQSEASTKFGLTVTIPVGFSTAIEPTGIPATAPVTLTFPTFADAANMAGISRLYGGIHFQDDNAAGLLGGQCVGLQAMAKAARAYGFSNYKAKMPSACTKQVVVSDMTPWTM
jgi:hypothetical protein